MDAVQVKEFLTEFVGAGKSKATFETVENQKRATFEQLFSEMTPQLKDQIREGMTFQVVDAKGKKHAKSFDKEGQEKSVDTFGSTKKGHGISSEDQPKVQRAMDAVVALTRKAIDRTKDLKTPDGRPVYDLGNPDKAIREKAQKSFTTLIELEVFSPLVREGILPENFVVDDFSEVQKLLNNTFNSYRESTEEARSEKELADAKMESDYHGAGGKLDMLKGLGGKAGQMKDHLVGKMLTKVNKTPEQFENLKKNLAITAQFGKVATSLAKAGVNMKGWVPDQDGAVKNITAQEKFLDPSSAKGDITGGRELDEAGELLTSDDSLRVALDQSKRQANLESFLETVGSMFPKLGLTEEQIADLGTRISGILDKYLDSDGMFYPKASFDLLKDSVEGGIDIALKSYGISKTDELIDGVSKEFEARKAAEAVISDLDTVLSEVVTKAANPLAGAAFSGLYSAEVDLKEVLENTAPDTDGQAVVDALADAFAAAFNKAAPGLDDSSFDIFSKAGTTVASAFRKEAPSKELEKALKTNPQEAFAPVVKAARSAVAAGMSTELTTMLQDGETIKAVASKSAIPDEEAALDELEKSDEELKEYERTLVLIDDAGVTAAEQRSIEKLIAQLEKDRKVLELVAGLGSTISGVGGGATDIANWATDQLTDVVAGNITGAFKAAQLIMQLAVNVKKAADRWALWYKFKVDLSRSKKAVSSLSSTIQGFFNNKKEQIAFRTIEDALLAVQAAAAIMGSVPEPYSMAIGKSMSLVASVAQETLKFSEMIHDKRKLAEAWSTTKAALDNPRDRALGLKALRLNPTLGMHAIAWAGMEKSPPDPIARMFLNSVGLNEQTLAVSGSEKKVRQYLETLLNEDRQLLDPSKLKTDWAPETYTLSVRDWFIITSRGQRDASPKLRPGDEKTVLEALKKTDKHELKKLQTAAEKGALDDSATAQLEKEALALCDALRKYVALATDGSPHDDMSAIGDEFLKMAVEHKDKVLTIVGQNAAAKDPTRVTNLLDGDLEVFSTIFGDEDEPPTGMQISTLKTATETIRGHIVEVQGLPAFVGNTEVQTRLDKLSLYAERSEIWMTIQGFTPPKTRPRRG